jgi:hypothetical protein
MPKPKKDLVYALAERIGGEKGERMRATWEKPPLKGLKAWDEIMTDEDFAAKLEMIGDDFAAKGEIHSEPPGTWGQSN